MNVARWQCVALRTACRQVCVLTFSGLSGEASTKDWEKCTIPTFLFSQNRWHHELGKVFRQSSYSRQGATQGGRRGERMGAGRGGSVVKERKGKEMTTGEISRFLPRLRRRKGFTMACNSRKLIRQKEQSEGEKKPGGVGGARESGWER